MATLNSTKRNTSGHLDAGYNATVRVLDFVVDLSTDVTMGTATDDIQLATLPAGVQVIGVMIQQLTVGTGTGTLVGRVGATTVTGTLVSTDAVGTVTTLLPTVLPVQVPLAGAELNLLGATAVRTTGKIRVTATLVGADRSPKQPTVTSRDRLA